MRQERSEAPREQMIALNKSDQLINSGPAEGVVNRVPNELSAQFVTPG